MNLGWMEKITKRNKKKNEKTFRDLGSGFVYLLFGQLSVNFDSLKFYNSMQLTHREIGCSINV